MSHCPCGNSRALEACCGRFLEGKAKPASAEELMRSRYTAFALGNVDYVCATQLEGDRDFVQQWAESAQFQELRILAVREGGADDGRGEVEFEADYLSQGKRLTHREHSFFERRDGDWVFVRGKGIPQASTAKVGRNDPCVCGSGKKFKKCCG